MNTHLIRDTCASFLTTLDIPSVRFRHDCSAAIICPGQSVNRLAENPETGDFQGSEVRQFLCTVSDDSAGQSCLYLSNNKRKCTKNLLIVAHYANHRHNPFSSNGLARFRATQVQRYDNWTGFSKKSDCFATDNSNRLNLQFANTPTKL
jgi:hypothetical protein